MPSTKNLLLANIEGLNHDDGNFVEVTKSHQPIWDVGIWWKNYFFISVLSLFACLKFWWLPQSEKPYLYIFVPWARNCKTLNLFKKEPFILLDTKIVQ